MPTTPPIILGTVSHGNAVAPGPATFSHTVTPGTDALLIFAPWGNDNNNIVTVTYGATTLRLLNYHAPLNIMPATFLLLAPPAGTATVTIAFTPSSFFDASLAGSAVNIANFGGLRFADWAYSQIDPLDPPLFTPNGKIHCEATDLVLTMVTSNLSGQTFVPDASQTLLYAENAVSGTRVRTAMAVVDAPGTYASTDWTLANARVFDNYIIAIKGLDGEPAVTVPSLGPVTNTFTTENQPAPEFLALPPPPGDYWRWYHEVPTTHRFLTVLISFYDVTATITGVTFNGVALTQIFSAAHSSQWVLEVAPVGTFLIEVQQTVRRTFMAGAYSLSTSGIISTSYAQGFSPALFITTQADAIAILMADYAPFFEPYLTFVYAPVVGEMLFDQPAYLNSNTIEGNRANINDTLDHGFSFYQVATGAGTTMAWTIDPTGWDNIRIAFSYVPVTPPPPPNPCPGRRTGQQTGA